MQSIIIIKQLNHLRDPLFDVGRFIWIIYNMSYHANQIHLTCWFQTHAPALTHLHMGIKHRVMSLLQATVIHDSCHD